MRQLESLTANILVTVTGNETPIYRAQNNQTPLQQYASAAAKTIIAGRADLQAMFLKAAPQPQARCYG